MTNTNIDNISNNNIKPCWWGPHVWKTIYFMVAVYPNNPSHNKLKVHVIFLRV